MIDPVSIIADALFDYRDPAGKRLWGRDRSFDKAATIIDSLAKAGFVLERSSAAHRRAANIEKLLNMYRDGVNVDVTMEGPVMVGPNISALRRAWEADKRGAFEMVFVEGSDMGKKDHAR